MRHRLHGAWLGMIVGMLFLVGCADEPSANRAAGSGAATIQPQSELNMTEKIVKSDEEWRELLTPEQYRIMREAGTERPFSGEYNETTTPGLYRCAACGQPLFASDAKFASHCGWPSFFAPADGRVIDEHADRSLGMTRTEIRCSRCDAHLGHVFDDGPPPTGKRYCLNSVALKLEEAEK